MKKITIFLLFFSIQSIAVSKVSDLLSLASNTNEFPKNEGDNWVHPSYKSAYLKLGPNFFQQLLGRQTSLIRQLNNLLHDRSEWFDSNKIPLQPGIKLRCEPNSSLYVWGDLNGGFHSLSRSLLYLKAQGVIDNNFTILQSDSFFIFNGNCVGNGPFNSETLVTILLLMKKNPENVFYLQGKNERKKGWMDTALKEELMLRSAPGKGREKLLQQISTFFKHLPRVLFVTTPKDSTHFIRISPLSRNSLEINESAYMDILSDPSLSIQWFDLQKKPPQTKNGTPEVVAIIKEAPWRRQPVSQSGLNFLPDDRGSTSWSIISSAIELHQKLIRFSKDAFTLITIKEPLSKSAITLFNRDQKEQQFKKNKTFNLVSGIEEKDGAVWPKDYFSLGSSMSLVQGVPIMGQRTKRGMDVRLKKQNQAGGVNNILFRSTVYNDNYTPQMTRKNINRLMDKNKIDTILLPVGSPTLAAYIDYLKNNKVAVLFPITGGPQFRDPKLPNIVHFRGTYAEEVRALVNYTVQESGAKKFAFFYQDDAYGKGPLEAAHEELRKKGITNWVDVPYQRNSVNYKKQAQIIREAQPDAIGLFSTSDATRELLRQIGIDFLTNKILFGISFLAEESFRQFLDHKGLKVLFGAVVPNPNTSQLEIVKEYRAEMDKNGFPYDVFSLEAYITTSILLEMLKNITPPITKEKIIAQLESLNDYPFKGLLLTFNPAQRSLAKYIWLESGKDKEWVQMKIENSQSQKKEDDARSINTSGSEQLPPRPTSTPS